MSTDRSWDLPESQATPPEALTSRRRWLRTVTYGALASGGIWGYRAYRGSDQTVLTASRQSTPTADFTHTPINSTYAADDAVTAQIAVARHVNFYEFSPYKHNTWRRAAALPTRPWELVVTGAVQQPRTYNLDDLIKMFDVEQRVYRHRCVETWAMVVPWIGIPLRAILERSDPLDAGTHVRFVSADIEQLTARQPPIGSGFHWPYEEGLTLAEAMHELAFLAVGFYGEPIFRQNGAPVRLVVPWKYGFKSAKSIVKIEVVRSQPRTFWNTAEPSEYGFFANVNPHVDHPRWSQKTEWLIDTGCRQPTQPYNGYAKWVSDLYSGNET